MNTSTSGAAPVSQTERIVLIDSLRGIALLGILLMNIPYFGLPEPAFDNLVLMNEMGTINQKVWYFINMVPEGTQRAIFSTLFGAGIILFISRLEKRMEGMMPAEYFIRRQLWLVVFGLFNAFILLWPGDILFQYGILGIVAFVFRRLSVKKLLIAAGVCLLLMTARENLDLHRTQLKIQKGEAIAKIDTTKVKLTEEQKDELGAMTGMKEKSDTAGLRKEMKKNLATALGSYNKVYERISNISAYFEFQYTYYGLWDILLFMFLGMAFFKNGYLTGQAKTSVYLWMAIVGLGLGIILTYFRLQPILDVKFNRFDYLHKVKFEMYELSRMLRSIGLFGFIMLLYKLGWFNWLFKLMQPVGQMAFTNYLMQSLMSNLFFLGIGFGMMGKLQRYEIYYVVFAIWIIEIIWSHIWLRFFRFGPLEWCWRSLTYWKLQPIKKQPKENLLMEDDVPKE
ncbi:MAG TPA: DUF418 domain-containing protein [Lacibacter sp.]|nr:DUF418 domain-containing protein [Lacibacter sp.]